MEQTLLLNATYEPLKVVNWQKAITLLCQGKVEVISVYDREIRAVSFSIKLPSVIRLLRYIKIKRRFDYVPYSILSGTHVRHFTRQTIRDLFEATGFRVASIDTVTLPVSPEDAARLARLSAWPGASEDLGAAEFLVVAGRTE